MAAFRPQTKLKKIKVECLRPEEAWELFLANTGEVQSIIKSDGRVHERAQIVVDKCAGLPLALVVIARAMSSNKTWREWEDVVYSINDLRLQELWDEGTDPLYHVLRVSYDRLMNDQMRKCFLCCALWPEDFNIQKEDLFRCWLGIGLITNFHNIADAFNKGHTIIERLKRAAMLEETEINLDFLHDESHVKLHDIMRGMALWIASDHEKWIVQTRAEMSLATTPEEERSRKWREAEVVSLMFSKVKGLSSQFPCCPNIKALLLRETKIIGDVDAHVFLQNIHVLQYLDMPGFTGWYVFDSSKLLRDLSRQLVGLQCLDLSYTDELKLPKELVDLKKLKYLFIRGGVILSIPRGLISGLEKLEILDLTNTTYLKWETLGEARIEELGSANAAGGLKGIGLRLHHHHFKMLPTNIDRHLPLFELKIVGGVDDLPTLELSKAMFPGGVFQSTLRSLMFNSFFVDAVVISAEENDRLDNLELLEFHWVRSRHGRFVWEGGATPQVLFQNVSSLTFSFCFGVRDLGWIAQLPYLDILAIQDCDDLEQVISGKEAAREIEELDEAAEREQLDDNRAMILPKLRFLHLDRLSRLRSFCDPTVTLPSLRRVDIRYCPNLNLSFLEKTEAVITR